MPVRSKGREIALQVLYQMELSRWDQDLDGAITCFLASSAACGLSREHPAVRFAMGLLSGVLERRKDVDELIQQHSKNWRMDRMALVDRNVLRIGAYELCCSMDVPSKVVINEAVELGKRFGSEDSGPFINGILDAIRRSVRSEGKG